MSLNTHSMILAPESSVLDRGEKVPERVQVSDFKFYSEPSPSMSSDLMLASTSQILTEPPSQIKKYVQECATTNPMTSVGTNQMSGTVQVASGANVTMVKERVILSCHRCDYKTFHRHALDRHIQAVHDKVKLYQCQKCDYKTGHASALKRHQSKVHDKSMQMIYACEACDYHTIHKSALKRHIANRHQKASQVVHQCSVCEYSTTYEFALERHISTVHLKEGAFECNMCEYNTVHKHALDRHVKMVHEKPPHLACDMCDYKTAHKSALKMHFATVHEAKDTYRCEKCGYETLYKTALHRHQTTVVCGQGEKVSGAGSLNKQSQNNMILQNKIEHPGKSKDMEVEQTINYEQMLGQDDLKDSEEVIENDNLVEQMVYVTKDQTPIIINSNNLNLPNNFSNKVRHEITLGNETYQIAGIQKMDGSISQMIPLNLGTITMIEKDGVLQPVNTIQMGSQREATPSYQRVEYHTLGGEVVQVVRSEGAE